MIEFFQNNSRRYKLVILKECKPEECNLYETQLIEKYQTFRYKHGKGFNFTSGGDGSQRKPDLGQDDLHGVELILCKYEDAPYYFKIQYVTSSHVKKTLKAKSLEELLNKANEIKLPIFSYSDLIRKYPYDTIHIGTPRIRYNPLKRNPPMITEHINKIKELDSEEGENYIIKLISSIYGAGFLKKVKLICEVTGFIDNELIQEKLKEKEYFVDTTFYERYLKNLDDYKTGKYICSYKTYEKTLKFVKNYENKYKN